MKQLAMSSQYGQLHFAVDNKELLLKDCSFNLLVMNRGGVVLKCHMKSRYSDLLVLLRRKVSNNQLVAIVAQPNYEISAGCSSFSLYLGLRKAQLAHNYWCYLGLKQASQFKCLAFDLNTNLARVSYSHTAPAATNPAQTIDTSCELAPEQAWPSQIYVISQLDQPSHLLKFDSQVDFDYSLVCYNPPRLTGYRQALTHILTEAQEQGYPSIVWFTDSLRLHTDYKHLLSKAVNLLNQHSYVSLCVPESRPGRKRAITSNDLRALAVNNTGYSQLLTNLSNNVPLEQLPTCYLAHSYYDLSLKQEPLYLTPKLPEVVVYCADPPSAKLIQCLKQQSYPVKLWTNPPPSDSYLIELTGKCLLPYCFVARALAKFKIDLIDGPIRPRIVALDSSQESNLLSKLSSKEVPIFISAQEMQETSSTVVCWPPQIRRSENTPIRYEPGLICFLDTQGI